MIIIMLLLLSLLLLRSKTSFIVVALYDVQFVYSATGDTRASGQSREDESNFANTIHCIYCMERIVCCESRGRPPLWER